MILLSGGTFQMGAVNESEEDPDTNSNEFPVHSVTQTGPFLTGKHEVTASQFKACVDAGGCSYSYTTSSDKWTYNQPRKENYPTNYVSWNEALEYSAWKSARSSRSYRFCTETEWEYAVRSGTTSKWSCGDSGCLTDIAWYDTNNQPTGTKEVKTKQANPWGLYDVHGKVWEWDSNNYSSTYSGDAAGVNNPGGP